jgi:hypothetical protein
MRASDYKEFSGLKSKSTKKVKPKKASKAVTPKMLKDKGFSNDKEGLRDFMNTFKYDEDKGYVKRAKALKRVGEPEKKSSGRDRTQTKDTGKNVGSPSKDKGSVSSAIPFKGEGSVYGGRTRNITMNKPTDSAVGVKGIKTADRVSAQSGPGMTDQERKDNQLLAKNRDLSSRARDELKKFKPKPTGMKAGGKVKAKKKTTRKFRGDGIVKKGKTKCKMR